MQRKQISLELLAQVGGNTIVVPPYCVTYPLPHRVWVTGLCTDRVLRLKLYWHSVVR